MTTIHQPNLAATITYLKDGAAFHTTGKSTKSATIPYPVLASPKIDGFRCSVINSQAYTRSMRHIDNIAARLALQAIPTGIHLDGELIVGSNPCAPNIFNASTSAFRSHEGCPKFTFWVFDLINLVEPYSARLARLRNIMSKLPDFACLVPQITLYSDADAYTYLDYCIADGYEGIMLRNPASRYKPGRSTLREFGLCKLKPFEDQEAVVVGFYEQMTNTNELETDLRGYAKRSSSQVGLVGAGSLGGVIAHNSEWGYFRVGGGWTQAERDYIWQNQSKFLGNEFTFKFQRIGSIDKPRQSGFKAWTGVRREVCDLARYEEEN